MEVVMVLLFVVAVTATTVGGYGLAQLVNKGQTLFRIGKNS